jgi:hypothetical protein
MTTDKELLESAAKAAGLTIEYWAQDFPVVRDGDDKYGWNPLYYDSDALRLAVKMKIDILNFGHHGNLKVAALIDDMPPRAHAIEDCGDDPAAATRRAIVRAAAVMFDKVNSCAERAHEE